MSVGSTGVQGQHNSRARTLVVFVVVSVVWNSVATALECVLDTDEDTDAPRKLKPADSVLVVLDACVVVTPVSEVRPYMTVDDSVGGIDTSLYHFQVPVTFGVHVGAIVGSHDSAPEAEFWPCGQVLQPVGPWPTEEGPEYFPAGQVLQLFVENWGPLISASLYWPVPHVPQ
jgi:hypothetical protein